MRIGRRRPLPARYLEAIEARIAEPELAANEEGEMSHERAQWFQWLVCAGLALGLTACFQGNERSQGPDEVLRGGPYSVDGIVLGSAVKEVLALVGEPREVQASPNDTLYRMAGPSSLQFAADDSGRIIRVSGRALLRGDTPLVSLGQGREAVEAALGRGIVEEFYRPTGGGIITTGSEYYATEYTYRDELGRYRIYLYGGDVTGIHAEVHRQQR
jgi:hypothetical protein